MLGGGAGCRMLVLGRCPDSVSVLLCITDGAAEGWHPLVISCWSDQPRAKEKAGGSGGAVFRAVPRAPRGALGGFLSAGKVFQHRVMFDGFVRPGMATALGAPACDSAIILARGYGTWLPALGLGLGMLTGAWPALPEPQRFLSLLWPPPLAKGMFFLLFSMQRKLPQADLGQERLQLTWPVQAGLENPGKVLVGMMVPASPLQEPSRIEEEPEGQSCCSHLGWMDRQTSS